MKEACRGWPRGPWILCAGFSNPCASFRSNPSSSDPGVGFPAVVAHCSSNRNGPATSSPRSDAGRIGRGNLFRYVSHSSSNYTADQCSDRACDDRAKNSPCCAAGYLFTDVKIFVALLIWLHNGPKLVERISFSVQRVISSAACHSSNHVQPRSKKRMRRIGRGTPNNHSRPTFPSSRFRSCSRI